MSLHYSLTVTDKFTTEKRSQIMSAVRNADTKPEKTVRRILHRMGCRFRLHAKELPGKPDIVFRPKRKVIFVNGCFWHGHKGCSRSTLPDTNKEFWENKIGGNTNRDLINLKSLSNSGWKVLVIWECELKDFAQLEIKLLKFLEGNE